MLHVVRVICHWNRHFSVAGVRCYFDSIDLENEAGSKQSDVVEQPNDIRNGLRVRLVAIP